MIYVALDGIYFFCYATSAVYTTMEGILILVLFWPEIVEKFRFYSGKS